MKNNKNIYISVMVEWKGFNMMNTLTLIRPFNLNVPYALCP
jgi:hypothetical protein